ncbi:hypothetical protein ABWK22_02315 [Gottfriedia acidiceleris]|uniref:hypothetical protein n=1 Tax=Gottfriedia acidiceleris TaxID=371036 RepID=UPI003397E585
MKKFISIFISSAIVFSFVGPSFADAAISRSSSSSFRSSSSGSSFKSSSSSSVKSSSRSSYSSVKSSTSKPKSSPTKSITIKSKSSKPKTVTTNKSVTKAKITTVKPKTTPTKPSTTIKKPATVKPQLKPKTKWTNNSALYTAGKFAPYLLTAGGAYLIYEGLEDDGDPIYVDSKTGEEVDDDDLESLGVQKVDSLPSKAGDVKPAPVKQDSNSGASIILTTILIIISLLILGILIYNLFSSKRKW